MSELESDPRRLQAIWEQTVIPVIVRSNRSGVRLKVRLPFAVDNREWLRQAGASRPDWIASERHWYLPKAWFNRLVDMALLRYGKIYIVQPYRSTEICAPACWDAVGHICECSCQGKNHGCGDGRGFFVVSETFAIALGEEFLACRLLIGKQQTKEKAQLKPFFSTKLREATWFEKR